MQIKVELLGSFGSDSDVAHAAWVSSGKEHNRTTEEVNKLLEKIIKDGHDSCLEHVKFRFRIEAPLYIMQQVTRTRKASHNQASARYQYPFKEYLRLPDDIMNQISTDDFEEYYQICEQGLNYYNKMVEKYKSNKRVTDVLRGALPTATMSALVMTINLRSWLNFYKQRSDNHAQVEIQTIAQQMKKLISGVDSIKTIYKTLEKNERI